MPDSCGVDNSQQLAMDEPCAPPSWFMYFSERFEHESCIIRQLMADLVQGMDRLAKRGAVALRSRRVGGTTVVTVRARDLLPTLIDPLSLYTMMRLCPGKIQRMMAVAAHEVSASWRGA